MVRMAHDDLLSLLLSADASAKKEYLTQNQHIVHRLTSNSVRAISLLAIFWAKLFGSAVSLAGLSI